MKCPIIAVSNQKGGVGKTTTAVNLAQAFALLEHNVLIVDLDPQGNASEGLGIKTDRIKIDLAEILRNKDIPISAAIYKGDKLDILPTTSNLAAFEREMVGMTNGELRLRSRLRSMQHNYSMIVIDTPPSFGTLMNSALNAADYLIVPIDCSYYAMTGIKKMLGEIEAIREGTNPSLEVLGYLMTLADSTRVAESTLDSLVESFGDLVFETKIRRSVKLKEAPLVGKTIFHHAPTSSAALEYSSLALEVLNRIENSNGVIMSSQPQLSVVQGGACHE